jgi:hypothetical protein
VTACRVWLEVYPLYPPRGARNQNANDCTKGGIFDARRRKDRQRRHRQAKGGPATVKISGREEQRRQRRANRPPPVGPAAWIDEGATWTRLNKKRPGGPPGRVWPSEFPPCQPSMKFFPLCHAHFAPPTPSMP